MSSQKKFLLLELFHLWFLSSVLKDGNISPHCWSLVIPGTTAFSICLDLLLSVTLVHCLTVLSHSVCSLHILHNRRTAGNCYILLPSEWRITFRLNLNWKWILLLVERWVLWHFPCQHYWISSLAAEVLGYHSLKFILSLICDIPWCYK